MKNSEQLFSELLFSEHFISDQDYGDCGINVPHIAYCFHEYVLLNGQNNGICTLF